MSSVLVLKDAAQKHWTYDDYLQLDDDRRYELFAGELIPMYPGPDLDHQGASIELAFRMKQFVDTHHLGRVFTAPLDVVFDSENTAQPDVLFVSQARASILQRRGVFGAPDLVVEIVSPSSISHDRTRKRKQYARFGVPEFWIVDPRNQSIEVFELKDGDYEVFSFAAEQGRVRSKALPGFEFEVADLA